MDSLDAQMVFDFSLKSEKRTLQGQLVDAVNKYFFDFYQRKCRFASLGKDRYYQVLTSLLEAYRVDETEAARVNGFKEIRMVGLPEFRLIPTLATLLNKSDLKIKKYIGFEFDAVKHRKIANHYNQITRYLGFPITMYCGDIIEGIKEQKLKDINVFDLDFCEDTTSSKHDKKLILSTFTNVPTYKTHVPNLLLASKIHNMLEEAVASGVFAVGINFSARNVSCAMADRFRERIIQEIVKYPFHALAYRPTAYYPGRGSGMVGAWLILEKHEVLNLKKEIRND